MGIQRRRRREPYQWHHEQVCARRRRHRAPLASPATTTSTSGFASTFQFDNLPYATRRCTRRRLRADSHVYSLMLDPIDQYSGDQRWGGYIVFGPGFFHRSGKLDSSTAIPGSACNPFFTWWGTCFNASLPLNGNFLSSSQRPIRLQLRRRRHAKNSPQYGDSTPSSAICTASTGHHAPTCARSPSASAGEAGISQLRSAVAIFDVASRCTRISREFKRKGASFTRAVKTLRSLALYR